MNERERQSEEVRIHKAKQMRYRRPACKTMHWQGIIDDLYEIRDEIDEGRWMYGQYETLGETSIGTLDEETVYELQIAFSDLSAEIERMDEDMRALRNIEDEFFYDDNEEYDDPPVLFDCFFPAINYCDQVWGYDVEEHDYYGLTPGLEDLARQEGRKRLKHLTKDKLIECAGRCMEIARQYMSLRARYDGLSTALAVLKGEFEASLEIVKNIEDLYDQAERETKGFHWEYGSKSLRALNNALDNLPDRLWIE